MKKGIIVEHKLRYTIVMDKDGVFHKAIPMKEKEIGMETFYRLKESFWQSFFIFFKGALMWKIIPMVLMCLLLLSPLYIWVSDNKAYAVVSIDINPSLNITIDEKYHVLDIDPINDDAEKLMDNLEVKNHTITSLTDKIIEIVSTESEQKEADHPILMAVSYYNEQQDKHIEDELVNYYQQLGYQVAIYEVSEEFRKIAETEHTSMNELTAQALNKNIGVDEKQLSSDNVLPQLSLNNKDRELIVNFYNHDEKEGEAIQEEAESEQQEMMEDIEENGDNEVLKKETDKPAILPTNTSNRSSKQKTIDNDKRSNEKKKNELAQKENKDKAKKVKKEAKIKKENHGQLVSEKAKSKKGNKGEKVKKEKKNRHKHDKKNNKEKKKHDNKKQNKQKNKKHKH
ncbi:anti-sigma-I factor RsgI family protein [Gracilibacillus sp. HCP3S3_G5_1]|uniref:anti-sigma-I factor RsgI family protein n=1 Tax=unclassified Gracilibacillus TaxID=2625209 RepID=UPI003F8877BE